MRWLLVGAAVALTALLLVYGRTAQIEAAPMLPVSFAHIDHQEENCVQCHHNFVDTTGDGLCFGCHKDDPAIAADIETMFHDLCRGCHVDKQHQALDAGPARDCFGCHEGDELP